MACVNPKDLYPYGVLEPLAQYSSLVPLKRLATISTFLVSIIGVATLSRGVHRTGQVGTPLSRVPS